MRKPGKQEEQPLNGYPVFSCLPAFLIDAVLEPLKVHLPALAS